MATAVHPLVEVGRIWNCTTSPDSRLSQRLSNVTVTAEKLLRLPTCRVTASLVFAAWLNCSDRSPTSVALRT